MEIRQLRYFVTVAQTLNFSEAARRLYITQGTLSQQIQQLEFELGSQLFERSSHNVSLTEAGEELIPLAMNTISASEECMTRMNDLRRALSGTLRIGAASTFKGMITSVARSFMKEYRGVSLSIQFATEGELLEMLRKKEIDFAFAYKAAENHEDVESEVLLRISLQIMMRKDHPLSKERNLTLDTLAGYGIVIPGHGLQARNSFDRFIGIDTRRLDIMVETNDPDVAMDLVQCSDLLAISTPLPAMDRGSIVSIPFENDKYQMKCCVHRIKNSYRKKSAELFIEMLRDYIQIERITLNLQK